MKIGNIVSTNKVNVSDEFNVVNSLDEIIQGLPTLIVGFDAVNKSFPDFNVLHRELSPELFWTFKRTEKRDKYEEDLTWFIGYSYLSLIKDINYVFVDPIQYQRKAMKRILIKMKSISSPITYYNGRMCYIYGDKIIFGIDLKLLAYSGFHTDKIISKIKAHSSVFLEGDNILIEYKKNVEALGSQVRYIPFLYTVRNGQKNTAGLIYIS